MPSGTRSIIYAGLALTVAHLAQAAEPTVRRIAPDGASGISAAVVVAGATPLAHSTQILPLDSKGTIVGRGRADVQAENLLDRLDLALLAASSELDQVVKVNVYAARPEAIPAFKLEMAKRLREKSGPAVSFVVGALADPDALLALDAVAATSLAPGSGGEVTRLTSNALAGQRAGGHLAILPPGGRVYVSGQAVTDANLALATRRTLDGLNRTLKHLELDRSRVVQVKAFLNPMKEAAEVEREMISFFGAGAVPPLSLVEWRSSAAPIEIELVVAAGPHEGGDVVDYLTPPGLKPSPVFSRVVRVNRGDLIYLSDLNGPARANGEKQVEAIFDALGRVLTTAGSDFRHLVKATYYVTDDVTSRALNELRPKYYDPGRPPAASKATVTAVGVLGRSVTLDMIAVPKP